MPRSATSRPRPGAEGREHRALGQELPDEAPASRAKGHAHRQLVTPGDRAGEQDAGDVRAGDKQNEGRRTHRAPAAVASTSPATAVRIGTKRVSMPPNERGFSLCSSRIA